MVSWETDPHSVHASVPVWTWHLYLRSDESCLYTRLRLAHPCRSAGVVFSPSPPLSPLPTCMQRKKKRKKIITNGKWIEVTDKTRERKTTTTKIDWPRVYNNASDLEPPGWRAVATQSQNCHQPACGTRPLLLEPAFAKLIINERFSQTVHRLNSTGHHSHQW